MNGEATTQPAIWHNPATMQWELRDERGQAVAAIADEYLTVVPADLWEGAVWPLRAIVRQATRR